MSGGLCAGDDLDQPSVLCPPLNSVTLSDMLLFCLFVLYCHYFMFTLLEELRLKNPRQSSWPCRQRAHSRHPVSVC